MTEKTVLVGDLKANVKFFGSGVPGVIVHGWLSDSEQWIKVAIGLESKAKLIIPDLPGFGRTPPPPSPWGIDEYCQFLNSLLAELGLKRFFIVGHSFGGAVAVKYSLMFPEKVEKLFLVGASGIRKKSLKKKMLARAVKQAKIFNLLPFYPFLRKAFYRLFVKKSDYIYSSGVMKETFLKVVGEDISGILENVSARTFLIWGDKDRITPLKDGYLFREKIKNSKLFLVPGGGHDLERKNPDSLTKIISGNI